VTLRPWEISYQCLGGDCYLHFQEESKEGFMYTKWWLHRGTAHTRWLGQQGKGSSGGMEQAESQVKTDGME